MRRFLKTTHARRGGEIWQIIYIDLMTNVMVFFVILWSINQAKKAKITESLGDHTSRMVSLPGDVIFSPGKTVLSNDGKIVFQKLFNTEHGAVLNLESNSLMKRLLVIHGHTDSDGKKDDNFDLGYGRALSAYREIMKYSAEIPDHVILCTHADNSPAQEVPEIQGKLTPAQREQLRAAKAKNRRITIEDKLVTRTENP